MLKIALVGRPNVGKSALFNRIAGHRKAIVDDREGTTRDRLYGNTELFGTPFTVIDTGGIDTRSGVPFAEEIRRQAEIAIEEADSIVMVVDGVAGFTGLDESVARILRKSKKPICLAVNKIDDLDKALLVHEFHKLGIPKMVAVSATQGYQIAELLEAALEECKVPEQEEEHTGKIKVAIIGRPNVGKSTLLNKLIDEERSVVSPIAGTTRDAIDVDIEYEGETITLIDTAGIRRKGAEHDAVDKFAAIRTQKAIERADICLLMLDSVEGLTAQEKKIASMVEAEGKACILLFNKWDLVKGYRMEHCDLALQDEASFLNHCPRLFISSMHGRNLAKIMPAIREVFAQRDIRITTGQLNKFLEKAIQKVHPAMIKGKRLRIYYMAQVETAPPTFILFANYPKLMLKSYERYLMSEFRKTYPFTGNPLRFFLKARSRAEMVFSKEK
jgi:GTP-binding protein